MTDEIAAPEAPPRGKPYPAFLQKRWGAAVAALVGFVVYLVLAQIVPSIIVVIAIAAEQGKDFDPLEIEKHIAPYVPHIVLLSTLASVAMVVALRYVGWLAPAPAGGRGKLDFVLAIVFAIAICLLGQPILTWLLMSVGIHGEEQSLILAAAESGGVFFILAITVLAPLGEELVFRRFLFSTLRQATPWFVSYGASALAFGLIHGNPAMLPLYLWIALCATLAYERTGTIWAAIAVHAANNTFAVLFWEM